MTTISLTIFTRWGDLDTHLGEDLWETTEHGHINARVPESISCASVINAEFNSGGGQWTLTTGERCFANATGHIPIEDIITTGRALVEDGRFGLTLEVETEGDNGPHNMGLPKSVAKEITCGGTNYDDRDNIFDYIHSHSTICSYKVNESTGERNETGEKRMTRFLNTLDGWNF